MSRLKSRVERLEMESGKGEGRVHVIDIEDPRSRDEQLRAKGVDPDNMGPKDLVVAVVI